MQFRLLVVVFSLVLLALKPISASATENAEAFVHDNIAQALDVLADPALSDSQKAAQFEERILTIVDIPVVARFALGQFANTINPQELIDFTDAFRAYATSVYQSELNQFGNEVLEVHSSLDRKPGDCVVITTMSGGHLNKPQEIKWRVLTIKGEPRVVDIEVSGVWLTQNQRSDITSIIARNDGNVEVARQALISRTQ